MQEQVIAYTNDEPPASVGEGGTAAGDWELPLRCKNKRLLTPSASRQLQSVEKIDKRAFFRLSPG